MVPLATRPWRVSRVGFGPTQGWVKASCPTVLGDRLMGPTRFERAPQRPRRRMLSRLHQGPGGPVSRVERLRSSARATAASAAPSPLVAAERGPQVLSEPAPSAPDPEGPSRPESDHLLVLGSRVIGAERVERPPRGLRPRMLPLHHAPHNIPSRRTRRALALNSLGSPPRAVSDSSWRCGSWYRNPRRWAYFKVSG